MTGKHENIAHALIGLGIAALAAAIAWPRESDPNLKKWMNSAENISKESQRKMFSVVLMLAQAGQKEF